jgi:hypothetical protein
VSVRSRERRATLERQHRERRSDSPQLNSTDSQAVGATAIKAFQRGFTVGWLPLLRGAADGKPGARELITLMRTTCARRTQAAE